MKRKRTREQRKLKRRLRKRERRIAHRLREKQWPDQPSPMFAGQNIRYEIAGRDRGLSGGGIGMIHRMVGWLGLPEEINQSLHLLKQHRPYFESDHVLNITYNALLGGSCLEDIELRRNDEVFLDALAAERIPDPTTAGDFCRRFEEGDVESLQDALNTVRVRVWKEQPAEFLKEAIIDVDGTLAATTGECKEGMDIAYNGVWGYHPLLVSLANTQEPLYQANRSGNRPSHERAPEYLHKAIDLCRDAGFRRVTIRGDSDFSLTKHLDSWQEQGVRFVFGFDANRKLVEIAENLEESAWERLQRPRKYRVKTTPRRRPKNVKARIVREREYKSIRLDAEEVAEFEYQPGHCRQAYRVVVCRKNLTVARGEAELFDDIRYFFYITNDRRSGAAKIVFSANHRCNQENLIEQLKNGVRAMRMPVDNLVSNWAYMVMASLAWSLKAWLALLLPAEGREKAKQQAENDGVLRMEFRTFVSAFILIPVQLVKTGRRLLFRILAWNPHLHVFLRAVERFSQPLRC